MAEQMGLQGLVIPEEYGGQRVFVTSNSSWCSRRWAARSCAPPTSPASCSRPTPSSTRATTTPKSAAICRRSPRARRSPLLVAFTEENGKWDESGVTMHRDRSGDGYTSTGEKMFVIDGHTADIL